MWLQPQLCVILSRKKDGRFSSSSFHRSGITRQEVKEGIVEGHRWMGIDRKKGKDKLDVDPKKSQVG